MRLTVYSSCLPCLHLVACFSHRGISKITSSDDRPLSANINHFPSELANGEYLFTPASVFYCTQGVIVSVTIGDSTNSQSFNTYLASPIDKRFNDSTQYTIRANT